MMKPSSIRKSIACGIAAMATMTLLSGNVSAQTQPFQWGISQVPNPFYHQQSNQQPIVTGPAIWQIKPNEKLAPLPAFITPMVAPQQPVHYHAPINYQPYYPTYYPTNTVIIIIDNSSPYVVSGDMGYYPSVFSVYDGLPSYIYSPAQLITFDSNGNLVFQDIGNYYPYSFDPFSSEDGTPVNNQLPTPLIDSLNYFATGWVNGNTSVVDSYLPPSDNVSLAVGNQYKYSMGSSAFQQLASNSIRRLNTSDFRYTGVRVKPNGDAIANAVQTYRASDGSTHQSSIEIAFSKDAASRSGYRISGFGVGK